MWPRSQTSGLMIGECTRSRSSSLSLATSASVLARASSRAASACATPGEVGARSAGISAFWRAVVLDTASVLEITDAVSSTTALQNAEIPADRAPALPGVAQALAALDEARTSTLALVARLSDEDLERVHSPIMSPLVWDLGHIAAYEDLWLGQRHAGLELLRGDLAELYDAFETPRAVRGEIEALGPAEARDYLAAVRARMAEAIARSGLGDGTIYEMVL